MVNDLKYYNGSLQAIERIPEDIKQRYATAFEIEPQWLVKPLLVDKNGSIKRNRSIFTWLNLLAKNSIILYRMAWLRGLKNYLLLAKHWVPRAPKKPRSTMGTQRG